LKSGWYLVFFGRVLELKDSSNKKALSDEKAYANPVKQFHCWGCLFCRILCEILLWFLRMLSANIFTFLLWPWIS